MSNWWSKSTNKKLDNKQTSKTNLDIIKIDPSTNLTDSAKPKNSDTNRQNQQLSPTIKDAHQSQLREKQERPIDWEEILDREFESLDIDADGYISIADMQSVLKNFSHIYNSNEIILSIFEKLDRNHDQRISKQEFKLYKQILLDKKKRSHQSTFEEKLDSVFALFDRDQDNYISPHEIRETMRNLGEHIDDQRMEEMMQTADTNHDGRISRDEFKKLLLQLHSTQ